MEMENRKVLFVDVRDIITTPSGNAWAEDITDFRIKKEYLDKLKSVGAYWIGLIEHVQAEEMCFGEEMLIARLSLIGNFVMHYTGVAVSFMSSEESLDEAYIKLVETLTRNSILNNTLSWAVVRNREFAGRMEVEYISWDELNNGEDTGNDIVKKEG